MCLVEASRSPSAIWGEGEEERAAIVESDSKVPLAWALSLLALSALVLISVSQPAGAAGSCERDPNHEPTSLTFLTARLCVYSGDTVLSHDEFGTDKVTPAQSKAQCRKAIAEFAWFGLGPDDITWLAPWDDPRYKMSQTREVIYIAYKCSDGIPRLLVRLHEGEGLLKRNPSWMQFPERIPVEIDWFGRPKEPVPGE